MLGFGGSAGARQTGKRKLQGVVLKVRERQCGAGQKGHRQLKKGSLVVGKITNLVSRIN